MFISIGFGSDRVLLRDWYPVLGLDLGACFIGVDG